MSNPRLPAEMLDRVVDQLRDTEDALRNCCLVSKSWIPRTRRHLFTDIRFPTLESLISWMRTFPDPSTSPAHYVKNLSVTYPQLFTDPDAEAGNWIRWFSCVVHLEVGRNGLSIGQSRSLVPYRGFSPAIKSLRLIFAILPPGILNLILSFPLLEDLAVIAFSEPLSDSDDDPHWLPATAQPSSPPRFTGSLEVHLKGGKNSFARRLLSLPGGIHFRKLALTWLEEEDPSLMTALIEKCSHTLESLDIFHSLLGTSILPRCLHR
jgi:hypothetical protein